MDVPTHRWWHTPACVYSYTFRRWVIEEEAAGWQAQVVVVHSPTPLFPDDLLLRLLAVTPYAKEFLLIEQAADSVLVLDTWQRTLEVIGPNDAPPQPVRAYSRWWSYAECDVIEGGGAPPGSHGRRST